LKNGEGEEEEGDSIILFTCTLDCTEEVREKEERRKRKEKEERRKRKEKEERRKKKEERRMENEERRERLPT